ncbi:MAG: radical SAM family heme chaperone HemW [Bacilli bacterium]
MKDIVSYCYIHIPFCKKICTYCDFCKMYYNENLINKYLEALDKEIKDNYRGESLKTLYIGGGTPSCLNMDELRKLFEVLKRFELDSNCEFTFECNLNDVTEELLVFLKENNVNRLSIGVESFNEKILKILGRKYNFDIEEKITLVKKYFSNINIDLIYGVNGESLEDLKEELDKFIKLDVSHISIYSLILEDNTILKVNNYEEIDPDLCRSMYDYICDVLEKEGYIHYEISNFSKEGYESKHNLNYWDNGKYYGFGLGASGFTKDIRYSNTRGINKYLKGNFRSEEEIISEKIDMENFMILGLRKIKGVSKQEFFKRYNKKIEDVFDVSKLEENKDYYFIKKDNMYISNYILEDFINI